MRFLPIYLDLRDQRVVVAGAGFAAACKLRLLCKSEASIDVYGSESDAEVRRLSERGVLRLHQRSLTADDLRGTALLYVATESASENKRIGTLATAAGVLFNVVDDLEASRFITPALVDRDPVTVAVGTEGTAPVLARRIKADIEALLPTRIGTLARLAGRLRSNLSSIPRAKHLGWRRRFWTAFFSGEGELALRANGEHGLDALVERHLAATASPGRVVLLGAGPGDPELLTTQARRILQQADVVLYDRLVDRRVLELAGREVILIEVGKTPRHKSTEAGSSWRQHDINQQMVEHARAGRLVARLKSGDPLMFGRADEELDALQQAGIEYEVLPGITAASAAAAAMCRSLTRRGRNSAVRFATAQDTAGFAEHDWRAIARPGSVSVFYMGVRAARFLQGRLMLYGADPTLPVSIVENASRENQRIVCGQLGSLDSLLDTHRIDGPAVIFTGLSSRSAGSFAGSNPPLAAPMEAAL